MDDLVPIGRFSKMTRLSIKALRLYDELGLLRPARVDPSSGYRYYRPAQANLAEAIRILRAVEMPLDEIAVVVTEGDPEIATKRLEMHRERLEARLADQERMLRFLARLIDRRVDEGKESIMPYDVTVKELAPEHVVSVTRHATLGNVGRQIQEGFGAVVAAISSAGTQPAGTPFIVYHDIIDDQTSGDIEICVPVPPGSEPVSEVEDAAWKVIGGGPAATTLHHGPYDEIAPAYHTLSGWIQDHGHNMAGAPREVYLNDPTTTLTEDLLTEVQWPISDTEQS